MLVSHACQFIYLKTRKTAGTSVEEYLQRHCHPEGVALPEVCPQYAGPLGIVGARGPFADQGNVWFNHKSAHATQTELGDLWDRYQRVACIRNPFDKAVSAYYWHLSRKEIPDISFQTYVLTNCSVIFEDILPGPASITHIGDRPIVDLWVRYETLYQDLERVCSVLQIPWEPDRLKRYKAGIRPRVSYQELGTPEVRRCIEDTLGPWLEHYGYTF